MIARLQETADRLTVAAAMLGTGFVLAIVLRSAGIWP